MQTGYVCFKQILQKRKKKSEISFFFLSLLFLLFPFSFLPFSVPLLPPWVTVFVPLTLGDIVIVNALLFLWCGDISGLHDSVHIVPVAVFLSLAPQLCVSSRKF